MADKVDPRTGELTTANYGWTKPTVGASVDAWGGYINADLDGIDSTVHSIQTSIPAASTTTPVMNGTAAVGSGTTWARADHVHPPDTSRLALTGGTLSGLLTVNANLVVGSNITSNANIVVDTAVGTPHSHVGSSASSIRWIMRMGNGLAEGGSNVGADLDFVAYADNGSTVLSAPLTMKRSTGVCSFSAAIVNGPSDRTLKENIEPLQGSLDKVLALQGVSFNMIATPDKPEIGLIAQDVEPVVPEIVQAYTHTEEGKAAGDKLALDYPKLTAILIEAVKTLAARVAALEGTSNG